METIGLVVMVALAIVLIPMYGVMGGAYAVLIQRLVTTAGLLLFGARSLRARRGQALPE